MTLDTTSVCFLSLIFLDVEPIRNDELNQLAISESKRKTHWLVYPEKKGRGMYVESSGNNGDIVTWQREGNIINIDKTFRKRKGYQSKNKHLGGTLSNVAPVKGKNRRDFVGNGNIIGWC